MFAQSSVNVAPNAGEETNSSLIPSGSIINWAGKIAPPGWLFCDGANYLPDQYANLFVAIGQNFSAGTANNVALGSIEVAGTYSFTGTSFTTSSFGAQVNFYINSGSIVVLSGGNPQTGADINGLRILITSSPTIGTTGGTFEGTFLDVPASESGTGFTQAGFMDMLRISFQVPDTTGRTIRGAQGGESPFNIGERGGNDNINISANQLPSHAHGIPGQSGEGYVSFNSNGVGYGGSGNFASLDGSNTRTDAIVYDDKGDIVTASGSLGVPVSVVNPYVTISSIIKT